MIIVIWVILVLLLVVGGVLVYIGDKSWDAEGLFIVGIAMVVVSLFGGMFLTGATIQLIDEVRKADVIDNKVAMLQEANTSLENNITSSVEKFMEHEKGVYEALSPDDAIAIATAYPQLNSNQLVQSQIQTYKDNTNEIKRLKSEQIDAKVKRWWLYFGD